MFFLEQSFAFEGDELFSPSSDLATTEVEGEIKSSAGEDAVMNVDKQAQWVFLHVFRNVLQSQTAANDSNCCV